MNENMKRDHKTFSFMSTNTIERREMITQLLISAIFCHFKGIVCKSLPSSGQIVECKAHSPAPSGSFE